MESSMNLQEWLPMLIIVGGILFVGVLINVFVCWILSSACSSVPAEHREIEPGLVWLLLIPCFGVLWNFFVFPRISRSFRRGFTALGDESRGDCGEAMGWWIAGCAIGSIIPCVGYIAGLAYLVLLIIYLVKVNGLKDELRRLSPSSSTPPMR